MAGAEVAELTLRAGIRLPHRGGRERKPGICPSSAEAYRSEDNCFTLGGGLLASECLCFAPQRFVRRQPMIGDSELSSLDYSPRNGDEFAHQSLLPYEGSR